MSDFSNRPKSTRVSRRGTFFRRRREPALVTGTRDFNPPGHGDGDDSGSAGVREPRHPKPLGPMSGAGELPVPVPPTMIALPDPRR
jgi:hypothetical protein